MTSTTFTYDRGYQRQEAPGQRAAWDLGPDLPLVDGRAHTAGLPGAFADSAPDRWGRTLISKRLRARARAEGRTPPTVTDVDYLLGVSDLTRQGALRFCPPEAEGELLAADLQVPKLVELPQLLRAADEAASGADGGESSDAVKLLLDAGSASLGGARPKASVRDGDRLLIAKFPHPADEWDVMAWEKTVLDLAEKAGIGVPGRRLERVGGRHVLLLERFDRTTTGRRIGYLSAMSLVGAKDGEARDYLELAEAVADHGGAVRADLRQLWRRIAFSLAVNNVDDHLRNHGFLRAPAGWCLSPLFDVNPDPEADSRVTTIGWAGSREEAARALVDTAATFGMTPEAAGQALADVGRSVAGWRAAASSNGVVEAEVRRFAGAFRLPAALESL
ncbi:MAG: type II toxin-antitoxin system HipA family toxin [Actinobacteria bacterium]|nr:type II toxin-antitoxin system HipA family toxin [Actinomycetota bacterium]